MRTTAQIPRLRSHGREPRAERDADGVDRAAGLSGPPTVMIAADTTDTYDRFTVYGEIMARSPGNATPVPVPLTSTLFGVSMRASSYGTLAAVTRPSWAPSGVDIEKPSLAPYWRPDQPHDRDSDVARCPGYAGVARID